MLDMDKMVQIYSERAKYAELWTNHAKSCETCMNWLISDISAESDLYRLKCVEGWTYLTIIGQIDVIRTNPRQFGL